MKKTVSLVLLISALALTACGGSSAPATSNDNPSPPQLIGDATHGEELYKQPTIGPNNALGCASCHSVDEGVVIVGPSHYQVATTAESRVSGMSAEAYLYQSLTDTDGYIVEGFTAGIMPAYKDELSDQDISDLVAYLLTLR